MELEKAFEDLSGAVFDSNLRQGAHVAGAEIKSLAGKLVPVDTNALRLSIENSARETPSGLLIEVGPSLPYGKKVEVGSPPGTKVDPNALKGWAARKGLNPYAVAKAIEKKGSPAQPYMVPALDQKADSIPLILAQAIANAFKEAFGSK